MKPKDMPEPPDGSGVVIVVGNHAGVYRRDDAAAEQLDDGPDSWRWFNLAYSVRYEWADLMGTADEVYAEAAARKEV